MFSSSSATATAAAAAVVLGCLLAGCGNDSQPAPPSVPVTAPLPLRTLYVQAPLTGPAAGEGRAIVDAVRLVVQQHDGQARQVRVIVRALNDGGRTAVRDRPRALCAQRCACGLRSRRARRDRHVRAGVQQAARCAALRPAGLLLVSPLNAAGVAAGRAPSAPTVADEGTAPRPARQALGATRIARRQPAAGRFGALRRRWTRGNGRRRGAEPALELDASGSTPC